MSEFLFAETVAQQKAAIEAIEAARGDVTKPVDWDVMKAALQKEVKRRGAAQTVVTSVVELVSSYTETPEFEKDIEQAKDVLKFIAELTEGKIFVETCRARAVRKLSRYYESEGNVEEAKNLTQDIQVEAYTGMEMDEKLSFILDQMRLVLAVGDFVRVQIVSRKVRPKVFNQIGFEDYKDKYFRYLAEYHLHEVEYLEASKCFKELLCFTTEASSKKFRAACSKQTKKEQGKVIKEDQIKGVKSKENTESKTNTESNGTDKLDSSTSKDGWTSSDKLDSSNSKEASKEKEETEQEEEEEDTVPLYIYTEEQAKNVVCYCIALCVLAPPSAEQQTLIKELLDEPCIASFEYLKSIITDFLSEEIVKWPITNFDKIKSLEMFTKEVYPLEKNRCQSLRKAFLLKNFNLLSKYFSNINFSDVSELCSISAEDIEEGTINIEEEVADAICKGYLNSKIDRPNQVVIFGHKKSQIELLNISRENMNTGFSNIKDALLQIERERLINQPPIV